MRRETGGRAAAGGKAGGIAAALNMLTRMTCSLILTRMTCSLTLTRMTRSLMLTRIELCASAGEGRGESRGPEGAHGVTDDVPWMTWLG